MSAGRPAGRLTVEKHRRSRFWAVRDQDGELVVVAAYRRGAENVARLLSPKKPATVRFRGFET